MARSVVCTGEDMVMMGHPWVSSGNRSLVHAERGLKMKLPQDCRSEYSYAYLWSRRLYV